MIIKKFILASNYYDEDNKYIIYVEGISGMLHSTERSTRIMEAVTQDDLEGFTKFEPEMFLDTNIIKNADHLFVDSHNTVWQVCCGFAEDDFGNIIPDCYKVRIIGKIEEEDFSDESSCNNIIQYIKENCKPGDNITKYIFPKEYIYPYDFEHLQKVIKGFVSNLYYEPIERAGITNDCIASAAMVNVATIMPYKKVNRVILEIYLILTNELQEYIINDDLLDQIKSYIGKY